MPDPKHDRSDYVHWDSTEPDMWARLLAALHSAADSTEVDRLPGIYLADTPTIDAFARLRVSEPTTLFDSQNQYNDHRIHWETSTTNTSGNAASTHVPNRSEVQMYVEASDTIIRQTRRYFRYQPGKSHLILTTFVMDSPDAECIQRVGYFDASNGIFLENKGTEYNLVIRSYVTGSPVDTQIPRASWNLDSFDGNGPSGISLDLTKAQIFMIDMEWLGVGRVRCGFVIDGIPYYAHEFLHANLISSVYMTTPNLPIRYEISGTASLAAGKTLHAICSSVMSEGGFEIASGLQFSVDNEIAVRSVTNAAYVPLIAIRPKLLYGGIVNRGRIILEAFSLFAATNSIHYDLVFGGTITGGSWVSANDDSVTEYNVSGTAISGGIDVDGGYVGASQQSRGILEHSTSADFPAFLNIAGDHPTTPYTDSWAIAAIALGNSTDCAASMDFRELR